MLILGLALQTLGERETGAARLEQAVKAYEAALEERTREREPIGFAVTQMELSQALLLLGERTRSTELILKGRRAASDAWDTLKAGGYGQHAQYFEDQLASFDRALADLGSFSSFATATSGAELQTSCIEPPATVIEITGVNTKHARATARYTEPDIIKACHEGYVAQGGYASPEECIRQTKADFLGDTIRAEANCSRGTIKLGQNDRAFDISAGLRLRQIA